MHWIQRVAGGSFGVIRLLPVAVGAGYLLLIQDTPPTPLEWLFAIATASLGVFGGLVPLAVAVAQSALLVVADLYLEAPAVTVKVMASVAIFELAVRRPLRPTLVGGLALTAAYLLLLPGDEGGVDLLSVPYRIVVVVGAPLLLGAYLRAASQAVDRARELARDAEQRRELAEHSARLSERTDIGRELHDIVAHHVASIALRVGVAREVMPDLDPRVRSVFDDVHNAATSTLADLRNLVGVLRDPATVSTGRSGPMMIEPEDLPLSVAAVIDRSRRAGLDVRADIDPAIAGLDSVRGLALLRLVQEGLTNVAKHAAHGATVDLRIRREGPDPHAVTTVEVVDRAQKPAPAAQRNSLGYGLIGLRERLETVGGTLEAGPTRDGWRILAVLPGSDDPHLREADEDPALVRP
ncbi:hypothetical protein BH24ACT9_BH24ACT9_05200 [soil metagenome]